MQNIIGLSGFLTPLFKPPQIYRLIMQILLRYNKSFRLSIKVLAPGVWGIVRVDIEYGYELSESYTPRKFGWEYSLPIETVILTCSIF